jgi:hypothetical protein
LRGRFLAKFSKFIQLCPKAAILLTLKAGISRSTLKSTSSCGLLPFLAILARSFSPFPQIRPTLNGLVRNIAFFPKHIQVSERSSRLG